MLISHLIGTNISIWVTVFCQVTGILTGKQQQKNWEYTELNCSTTDKNYFKIGKEIDNNLQPFILEFCLLSITLLLNIYPRNTDKAKINTGFKQADSSQEFKCSPGLICGIILAVTIILSGLCVSSYTRYYVYDLFFNYGTELVSDVLTGYILYKIMYELEHNHHVDNVVDTADLRLLYATTLFGYIPLNAFILYSTLVSGDKIHGDIDFLSSAAKEEFNHHSISLSILLGAQTITNLISVVYQAMIISKAHSYKRKWYYTNKLNIDQKEFAVKKLSAARVKQWLLMLFMINISLWVTISFSELKRNIGGTYLLTFEIFGVKSMIWFIVVKLCSPIVMFYRIHSAAMIIFIWFKFS